MHKHLTEPLMYYCLLLMVVFISVELSVFIQSNQAYLADFFILQKSITLPKRILLEIFYFLFAQALLHLAFTFYVFSTTRAIIYFFHIPKHRQFQLLLYTWTLSCSILLICNQYYFPNSQFAKLTQLFLPPFLLNIAMFAGVILSLLTFTILILSLSRWFLVIAGLAFGIFLSFPKEQPPQVRGNEKTPNIIIIGIDSLRPDFLRYFGGSAITPTLDHFLQSATVFTDAMTPLARTFPSWFSIFTGSYPQDSQIRSNLMVANDSPLQNMLPRLLQNTYETVYATDETRFSNIDQRYGFDQIISPPQGVNDFLLGTFNDFPLSNLIINTPLGRWLFPYSFANRAAFVTYQPKTFTNLIKNSLPLSSKPLFLAIHLCLPHYPYLWAEISGDKIPPRARYPLALNALDHQLQEILMMLKQKALLTHAIIIVLSDHGEALELAGDRVTEKNLYMGGANPPHFYPPSLTEEKFNQSAGHGTDVLSLNQYRTLLAWQLKGFAKLQVNQSIAGVVSTLDIKPTLLDLLHYPPKSASGQSLLPALFSANFSLKRHLFLESDFSPTALRTVFPDSPALVLEGMNLFAVDAETGRLTLKPQMFGMILKSKQYADLYDHWLLANYPQDQTKRIYILVNLKNGLWTDDLTSTFAAHSPVKTMLKKLQQHFATDLEIHKS